MKRLVTLLLTAIFLLVGYTQPALAQTKPIAVLVDGLGVAFDTQPIMQSNRIMVPFRAIAEAINVQVTWNEKNKTVTGTDGKTAVQLQIGSGIAYRNGVVIKLDAPPKIVGNRTLIPLRFFTQAFGCKVQYDQALNGARITTPPKAMVVSGFYALGDSKTSSWQDLFGVPYPQTTNGNTDLVSEVALGWYSLDEQGTLLTKSTTGWQRPDGWEKVLEVAGTHKMDTEMVVHLTDGGGVLTRLLADDTAINKAAEEIAAEALAYKGVNLDLEGLGLTDTGAALTQVRSSLTKFVQVLADKLKANGTQLTLSLHPLNSGYKGYDYKELGKIADRIIIMAYDYGTTPEPVNSVKQAVELAKAVVPADKLILGISVPSETPDSVLVKVGIAKRYNLKGIALWRLGLVPDEMWSSLRQTIQVR